MRRLLSLKPARSAAGIGATLLALALGTGGSALACAGLIGSNGAVNLGRTTTLAAYHAGVEHYVTAFKFLGGGGQFGTLIPLPDVPTSVERGGAWTLQRLVRETAPPRLSLAAAAPSAAGVEVLLQTRVDALDLTVLKGGGADVADWAHGTPVHITIPVSNPWVPLRILGLGKQPTDRIDADVFLLTDQTPTLLPGPHAGMSLAHSAAASTRLLDDLRSDTGMGWVPQASWLTELSFDSAVSDLHYDLAVDASGQGTPSAIAAGLEAPSPPPLLPIDLPQAIAALLARLA